jgi:uncharacterized membrane protein YedE/YeeE
MKRALVAFLSGLVFALGLALAGMTRPSKILAFLDVSGRWDPTLAFVMGGAVTVAAIAFRLRPQKTSAAGIDRRLLTGAALFGLGWGLTGLCPGPAVTSLATGHAGAFVFAAAMIAGMAITRPA